MYILKTLSYLHDQAVPGCRCEHDFCSREGRLLFECAPIIRFTSPILATTYYNLCYTKALRDCASLMNSFEYGLDFLNRIYVFPFRGFVNMVLFCCFFFYLRNYCSHPLITEAFPYHSQCLNAWWHTVSCGIYSDFSSPGGAIKNA